MLCAFVQSKLILNWSFGPRFEIPAVWATYIYLTTVWTEPGCPNKVSTHLGTYVVGSGRIETGNIKDQESVLR